MREFLFICFVLLGSLSLQAMELSVDQFKAEAPKMKMLIVDLEGVLASDQRIVSAKEPQAIILSARDQAAIVEARDHGIYIVIVAKCRMPEAVVKWAREAGVSYLFDERTTKNGLLLDLHFKTFISEKNMAYIAGNSADLETMKACGLIIAPQDADAELKAKANFITGRKSGEGVLDEVIHFVISKSS